LTLDEGRCPRCNSLSRSTGCPSRWRSDTNPKGLVSRVQLCGRASFDSDVIEDQA
jgi:hypothetical protein